MGQLSDPYIDLADKLTEEEYDTLTGICDIHGRALGLQEAGRYCRDKAIASFLRDEDDDATLFKSLSNVFYKMGEETLAQWRLAIQNDGEEEDGK